VEDQVVELAGSVSSWQQRKLAEKVAASVAGVKGVENDILVRYEEKRQDAQIKDEIQKALRWDALVDHALIDVEVEGGKVELKGKVGSAAEKMRAKADAWVAGVSSVTIKNLQVVDWARNERLRKSKYVVKSDSAIRDAVKDALIYDPRVFSFKITPSVEDGTVTLSGTVDNIKAKRAAEQVARNTVGVFQVRNLIRIKTTKPSEAEIRANLESALAKDPYLEDDEIEPKVSNTTVELEGNVDTYYEKGRADDIAAKAYGVTSIENNLTVRNGKKPLSYDPYLADYYIYDTGWYDYQPFYTFEPDSEIRAEVQDELWWSPFVDAQDVEVEVDDGIVTLSGTVDTIGEWRVATQEAYEGGATWVRNQLRVE
jgi:osmotically-inducible protein OsmY